MIWNTVCIIEDEPLTLQLYIDYINELGINAKGYTRASQYFDEFSQFETNSILILDLCLPEMDGIEVMIQLKQMVNPPPIILVSGFDADILRAAEQLGKKQKLNILSSIRKPVKSEELQELLKVAS